MRGLDFVIAAVASIVAAAMHGYIFTLESVLFSRPRTQRMFEYATDDLPALRLWAFHQGVYNLLIGSTALAGAVALLTGSTTVGITLVISASTFMIGAALALIAADRRHARIPGLVAQALPPIVALITLAFA